MQWALNSLFSSQLQQEEQLHHCTSSFYYTVEHSVLDVRTTEREN